jgi:hypothetical protein
VSHRGKGSVLLILGKLTQEVCHWTGANHGYERPEVDTRECLTTHSYGYSFISMSRPPCRSIVLIQPMFLPMIPQCSDFLCYLVYSALVSKSPGPHLRSNLIHPSRSSDGLFTWLVRHRTILRRRMPSRNPPDENR